MNPLRFFRPSVGQLSRACTNFLHFSWLLVIAGSPALAHGPATQVELSCHQNSLDPYEPALVFARGHNKGKCLDVSYKRSIVALPSEAEGKLTFANFYHEGKFWIASLDPAASSELIYEIVDFPDTHLVAHTEVRIRFPEGQEVELREQAVPPEATPQMRRIREIAFSIEAVTPTDGEGYGLISGVENHFGVAYRFLSMHDMYERAWLKDKRHTRQYRLRVDVAGREHILRNFVKMATERGMNDFYNTFSHSCTTELFWAFDQSLDYSLLRELGIVGSALVLAQAYPPESTLALSARGLLYPHGSSKLPTLDQDKELLDLIGSGF